MEVMYLHANWAIGKTRNLLPGNTEHIADATEQFLSEWAQLCTRHDRVVFITFLVLGRAGDTMVAVRDPSTDWEGDIAPVSADTDTAQSFWTTADYVYKHPGVRVLCWFPMARFFVAEWARLCTEAKDDRGITMDMPIKTATGMFCAWDQATRQHAHFDDVPHGDRETAIAAARDLFQRARAAAPTQ